MRKASFEQTIIDSAEYHISKIYDVYTRNLRRIHTCRNVFHASYGRGR